MGGRERAKGGAFEGELHLKERETVMTVLYTDGGCSGNDQPDMSKRKMVMVVASEDGTLISERSEAGGSNNIAELMAVRDALKWAVEQRFEAIEIRSDSRNNVSWVLGKKVGKNINDRARVLSLKAEIDVLMAQVRLYLIWVPREENKAGHIIEGKYGV